MRLRHVLIIALLVAVGCAYVPPNVAADYDRINQNVQQILPEHEAEYAAQLRQSNADRDAAVASGVSTTVLDQRIAELRHGLLLSETTRRASASMLNWCMAHSHPDEVAAIKSQRLAAAAVPLTAAPAGK